MKNTADELLDSLPTNAIRRLLRALDTAVEELGANTPIRQVMALLVIALANKSGKQIGVREVDHQLGDLTSGSASKLLRSMMHIETERKPGVANTVRSERDPKDLRKWDLFLTPKGIDALGKIVDALEDKRGELRD